jgi:hypothetical protein
VGPLNLTQEEIKQAQRECQVTMAKFRERMEHLSALVDGHHEYSPEAFEESVNQRMPIIRRHAQVFILRLELFVKILNNRIERADCDELEGAPE